MDYSNDNFINPVDTFNSYNNETVQNNDVVNNEINEEPAEPEIKQGRFFNILSGILEVLLQRITFPVLVIQSLVALAVARPSEICTWTGSSGLFSFDQK